LRYSVTSKAWENVDCIDPESEDKFITLVRFAKPVGIWNRWAVVWYDRFEYCGGWTAQDADQRREAALNLWSKSRWRFPDMDPQVVDRPVRWVELDTAGILIDLMILYLSFKVLSLRMTSFHAILRP
jgi:hypothetical protein